MKKKSLLIISVIVLLLLIHFSLGHGNFTSKTLFTDKIILNTYQPVVEALLTFKRYCVSFVDDYFLLVRVKKENKQLSETVKLLALQNQSLQNLHKDFHDLDMATNQFAYLGFKLMPVKVLGFDPFVQSKTVWIDAGADKGIESNDILVSHDGLVGRVIQVYDNSSKILLLIDSYFSADAISTRTNTRCLVKGINFERLQAQHLPFLSHLEFLEKEHAVNIGDDLVTSGLSSIFPGGIPIGKVVSVDYSDGVVFDKSFRN